MKIRHMICMIGLAALVGITGCAKSKEEEKQKQDSGTETEEQQEWNVEHMEVLAELSDPKVTLYGAGGEDARGVVVEMGGKQTYFDWEYTSPRMGEPELYWNEKEKQLQVALSNASGSGVDAQELHVLQQTAEGELMDAVFDMEDYAPLLAERLSFTYDAAQLRLTLIDTGNGAEVARGDLSCLGELDAEVESLSMGDITYFQLGDVIWLVFTPGYVLEGWAAPQYDGMPELTVEVKISREAEKLSFTLGALEEYVEYEGDASGYYMNAYAEILDKYQEALSRKWGGEKLLRENMSLLCQAFYEDEPLQKVGFAFLDLNGDGQWELLIGAAEGEDTLQNVIFDAYTLVEDTPVQLFCGQERERYYLYEEEAGGYEIADVASSGAQQSAWYYYMVDGTEMKVVQAIVYDAAADAEHPWYMAYDDDWDVTNDTPVDEKMAKDIIAAYEAHYVLPEYFLFSYYE